MIDPCGCGLTPEIKEVKTVSYVALCRCGNHGPAMAMREWAVKEWNGERLGERSSRPDRKLEMADPLAMREKA